MGSTRAGRPPRVETPLGRMSDKQRDAYIKLIWSWLPKGNKEPLGSPEIAERLGIKQNLIGGLINDMRRQGALVGSVNGLGYYKIQNEDQLLDTIAHIVKRIGGIQDTVTTLYDNYDNYVERGFVRAERNIPRIEFTFGEEEEWD